MSDIVKSVFRQRTYEKLYTLLYRNSYCCEIGIIPNNERLLSDEKIGEYDIDVPMLGVGEMFFLEDIEKSVVIKKRIRSSDGSTVYYIQDEIVETENTKRSLAECEEKVLIYDKLREKIKQLEEEFKCYKNEYKYKNRFFNFN